MIYRWSPVLVISDGVDGVTFRLVPPDVSVGLRLIVSLGQKDNFQAGLQLVLWIISYKGKGESCL